MSESFARSVPPISYFSPMMLLNFWITWLLCLMEVCLSSKSIPCILAPWHVFLQIGYRLFLCPLWRASVAEDLWSVCLILGLGVNLCNDRVVETLFRAMPMQSGTSQVSHDTCIPQDVVTQAEVTQTAQHLGGKLRKGQTVLFETLFVVPTIVPLCKSLLLFSLLPLVEISVAIS